jgi:hypothetical protein
MSKIEKIEALINEIKQNNILADCSHELQELLEENGYSYDTIWLNQGNVYFIITEFYPTVKITYLGDFGSNFVNPLYLKNIIDGCTMLSFKDIDSYIDLIGKHKTLFMGGDYDGDCLPSLSYHNSKMIRN